jgi:hypothetical protein
MSDAEHAMAAHVVRICENPGDGEMAERSMAAVFVDARRSSGTPRHFRDCHVFLLGTRHHTALKNCV